VLCVDSILKELRVIEVSIAAYELASDPGEDERHRTFGNKAVTKVYRRANGHAIQVQCQFGTAIKLGSIQVDVDSDLRIRQVDLAGAIDPFKSSVLLTSTLGAFTPRIVQDLSERLKISESAADMRSSNVQSLEDDPAWRHQDSKFPSGSRLES
jgi:hypothetical protein